MSGGEYDSTTLTSGRESTRGSTPKGTRLEPGQNAGRASPPVGPNDLEERRQIADAGLDRVDAQPIEANELAVFDRCLGGSEYTHAAMAAWWNGRLMCLETIQGRGGRAVLLSRLVVQNPGRIDVYRANANRRRFDRAGAVNAMIEITGQRYGWWSLWKTALVHLPVVRLLVRADTDDRANGSLPFCSQAISRACRAGGVDPVPNLADRSTEPGDLARSVFFSYRFTLVPEEEAKPCEDLDFEEAECAPGAR